jgi:diguanylate cyclase (GGDEF)-like protein
MLSCTIFGFNNEITKEIKTIITETNLSDNIFISDIKEDLTKFKLDKVIKSDILIINSIGYTDSIESVMNVIKRKYPLLEIIIVCFNQSYSLAIKSFRSGARDVIQYPINVEDLKKAFERAVQFKSVYKRSESLKDVVTLVNIFSNHNKFKNEEDFYLSICKYFEHKKLKFNLSIIKKLKRMDNERRRKGTCEIEWKYDKKKKIDATKIKNLAKTLINNDSNDESYPFQIWTERNNTYIIMFLGLEEKYQYHIVISVKEKDFVEKNKDSLEHMSRLIQNVFKTLKLNEREQELYSLAHTDDVTGLYNQRKLFDDIDKMMTSYDVNKEEFSVLFIDLDHFKNVNDNHGHILGSILLMEVAKILKNEIRETDYLYRYGGDEFVILLPGSTGKGSIHVGERILESIKKKQFLKKSSQSIKMSVSIGIATYPYHASSKEEILSIADNMMYEAKQTGRGRVCMANEMFEKKVAVK